MSTEFLSYKDLAVPLRELPYLLILLKPIKADETAYPEDIIDIMGAKMRGECENTFLLKIHRNSITAADDSYSNYSLVKTAAVLTAKSSADKDAFRSFLNPRLARGNRTGLSRTKSPANIQSLAMLLRLVVPLTSSYCFNKRKCGSCEMAFKCFAGQETLCVDSAVRCLTDITFLGHTSPWERASSVCMSFFYPKNGEMPTPHLSTFDRKTANPLLFEQFLNQDKSLFVRELSRYIVGDFGEADYTMEVIHD